MADVPIRSITISDFRRLDGTRTLPLDAPIVLIHGANGTGKTSVLSALELGLTGQIRSLQRQDPRYTAHLPTLGQDFATVRVEVDRSFTNNEGPNAPLTAGGSRIEGTPALTPEASNFYGERCYLDQASLGRLLEIYQHREGKQESALAQFVNELLGLEQLDALRTGLSAANDLRSLKKLADHLADAANRADRATADLTETTRDLTQVGTEVVRARAVVHAAARSLGLMPLEGPPTDEALTLVEDGGDDHLIRAIRRTVADQDLDTERAKLLAVQRDLFALGGRLDAAAARPSAHELTDMRDQLDQAQQRLKRWDSKEGSDIQAWQRAAGAAGVVLDTDPGANIEQALNDVQRRLDSQTAFRAQQETTQSRIDADQRRLEPLQERLLDAQEHATALVEALASVRTVIMSDVCPVCDRDYAELGSGHLSSHVDAKVAQLSEQGQRLLDLRKERDALLATIVRSEADLEKTTAALLEHAQLRKLEERAAELTRLRDAWQMLRPAVEAGSSLRTAAIRARRRFEELETATSEDHFARTELARCADILGHPVPDEESVRALWEILSTAAGSRLGEIGSQADAHRDATAAVEQMEQALRRQADAVARVASAAQRKSEWEACVKEGRRRQAVARAIYDAATEVRTNVVQRVFTQSLNHVWMSLFSRLAPNEGFIPSFGIPTSSKSGLELTLRTIHREGGEGGSPQMMLSAGNLNTAALSLFLALHLAVDPVIPCLVFDDPVQAMDEVHVAQFAGLIRMLAKQHERQVIVAVHERELFDYLTLELSPAYEGDELLTIELGERALEQDHGITRHLWTPDPAIAG
ncbi:AAA family ATPase [Ornithinimicrobium pratense]|uniref:Nuclease SbcCD subunit C n=1 Tax=Ornithinimicrobium pratense TaxID=2593973 RepID=A0A5J6V2G1_9MICO|nr:AAA family ATPase [Ornithinimicrobium pratense]QFG67341.1 AAA family ATPase [Ornithinimicrobium pratense]